MKKTAAANMLKTVLLTILLGLVAGIVIWCFLKAVSVCTGLLWERLPAALSFRYWPIPACAVGGLLIGLMHKRFGNYPEELPVVMRKVKVDKYYDYHPMLVMLVCAFLPLLLGASVGPEAGLTGIIAALCYWVGDNVSYAKENATLYSEVGEAVTLGQLFHSPLFGILAVEESSDPRASDFHLSRLSKLVFYGLSTAMSFLAIGLLNRLIGPAGSGFPSFSDFAAGAGDYVLLVLYIPVGILLYLVFEWAEKLFRGAADRVPTILREIIGGAVIGIVALLAPVLLFSGEEQMGILMDTFGRYAPLLLIGVCLLKIVMTAFSIRFGFIGGHFFPLIFACVCMGYGLAMFIFPDPGSHVVFAAGAVTAATLGAQLRKPLAASMLMLLCFPVRMLFWLFLAAALGAQIAKLLTRGHRAEDTDKTAAH